MSDASTLTQDYGVHSDGSALDRVPVLTVVHHAEVARIGARHVIAAGDVVLGRTSPLFDAALQRPAISRRHAAVEFSGASARVRDLGSHNGSYVNGERITEHALTPGDVIVIGDVVLLYHLDARDHTPATHPTLLGVSSAIAGVVQRIALAAPRDVTVLVLGEPGVGKELVAAAIHRESGRSGELVTLNCSAVGDGVLQSELFGHARGAFSGATERRGGLVRAAAGGTLLLDEIGDATPRMQASLLRLIEQREYRPVGSDALERTDARFVAATNVDLEAAVESGAFRSDLYGRLNRWVVRVAPLRDRRADVGLLAHHFANAAADQAVHLAPELAVTLLRHRWPGNVRELHAVMEQVVMENAGRTELSLTAELRRRLEFERETERRTEGGAAPETTTSRPSTHRRRPDAETLIARFVALDCSASALADELGVGRTTLYRWFQQLGIDPAELRARWERGEL